jgi:protein TonB
MVLHAYRMAGIARSVSGAPFAVAFVISVLVHAILAPRPPVKPGVSSIRVAFPLTATLALVVQQEHGEGSGGAHSEAARAMPETTRPVREPKIRRAPARRIEPTGEPAGIGAATDSTLQTADEITADRYFTAEELDVYPRLRVPLQPELGAIPGTPTRILVQVSVSREGVVEEVAIIEGGAQPAMRRALEAKLRVARFLPALKDGRPVGSRIIMSIAWAPSSPVGSR